MLFAAAIGVWSVGGFSTSARGQCGCCGQHGATPHSGASGCCCQPASAKSADTQTTPLPPHGGQVTKLKALTLEVVYRPKEIRVYVYSPELKPQSVKDAKGKIAIQAKKGSHIDGIPLAYVDPPTGSAKQQDYLAATVDSAKIRDGGTKVTFYIENVPLSPQSKITFSQTVALSKVKPQVTVAAIDESDKAGIARQRVCPVTGAELGSMGDPIKVLIDGQPLYLCCRGCLAKVKKDPNTYLSKVNQSHKSR
jgi:YHS domain-containing protein